MLPNVGRSGPGVETEAASRTRKEPAAATARPWLVLAIVLTAAFMQLVDVSIVTVAVASIQDGLDAGYAQVQWVLAGYTLAFAVLLVTGSELGDRFGRKRVFILGTAAFTLASLLCGAAGNAETLIAARLLQGLAAALMYPQVYAVIQVTFPPRRRGTAFGILGGVVGLAAITGPLVGGLLIQADLFGWTWRPVFLVNIPVGLLAVVLAARFVPESRATDAGGQDLTGVLLVTAGLALLVYPLVQGRELGWPAHLFAMAGAGVAVLALFGLYERRREGRGRTPLVRTGLFRNRGFTSGLLLILVFYGAFLPFFLVFSVYLQSGLGYGALRTGVAVLPYALGSGIGSGVSVALAPRLGRAALQIGLTILIAGTLGVAWAVHAWGTGLETRHVFLPLLVAGLGFGFTVTPLVTLILARIPLADAGSASGTLTTAQQIGSSIGIAVLGAFFFGLLGSQADAATADEVPGLRAELAALHITGDAAQDVIDEFRSCFHDRAAATDPTAVPASCRQAPAPADAPVRRIVAAATTRALHTDFAESVQRTLLLQAVLFAGCLVLVFALPKVRGRELSEFEEKSQDAAIIG
ncbi:MFS transporter [Streptomyces sp. NBC_00273]|uniref:MFS transporter n=1 Tax=Streptomyces sp. NBC_00273 TaxID=2903644 RepID=UPI002E2B66E8|nr:MFS transporter [Streptomyces sp. NBC_00273]